VNREGYLVVVTARATRCSGWTERKRIAMLSHADEVGHM